MSSDNPVRLREAMITEKLRRVILALASDVAFKASDSPVRSCLTCHKFDEKQELCKQFKARPPARVIAFACPDYEDLDDIPF